MAFTFTIAFVLVSLWYTFQCGVGSGALVVADKLLQTGMKNPLGDEAFKQAKDYMLWYFLAAFGFFAAACFVLYWRDTIDGFLGS